MILIKSKGSTYPSNAFVTRWKTDNAGTSSSTQITVPTSATGTYACTVYWGDGSSNVITTYNDAAWTHTYTATGIYEVIIVGTFNGIVFNNGGDCLKLLRILQWGTAFRLGTTQTNHFYGCTNLIIPAIDVLNLTGTTTLFGAFRGCSAIVTIPSLPLWDTSGVTDLGNMFTSCSKFNQALSFNTSAVTSVTNMLLSCTVFNSAISMTLASCTNFSSMLQGCTAFNQSVASLNTAAATTMASMFNACTNFNQSVSNFNTANVTTMASMFSSCSAFNQDVSSFIIAKVTTASNMFLSSGFTITNYDLLLNSATGWPSQATILTAVPFHAGTAHYSAGNPTTGRAVLTGTKTWTITDGGTP